MRAGSFSLSQAGQAGTREQKLPIPPRWDGKGLPPDQTGVMALSAIPLIS